MKNNIKKKWVEALRSGQYKQGRNALKLVEMCDTPIVTHCCLGVLCELYIQENPGQAEWINGGTFMDNVDNITKSTVLTNNVARWAGITRDGTLKNIIPVKLNSHIKDHFISTLACANDGGYTFEEIAQLIENDEAIPYDTRYDKNEKIAQAIEEMLVPEQFKTEKDHE